MDYKGTEAFYLLWTPAKAIAELSNPSALPKGLGHILLQANEYLVLRTVGIVLQEDFQKMTVFLGRYAIALIKITL